MPYDEFSGEMSKHRCSEPTAAKIWSGTTRSLIPLIMTTLFE
jgi:hypothetical protein